MFRRFIAATLPCLFACFALLVLCQDSSAVPIFGEPQGINISALAFYGLNGADLNGDHKDDILVAADSGLFALLSNGDGTFQTVANFGFDFNFDVPSQLAIGDINRDGKLDLAATNNSRREVSLSFGQGNGQFEPISPLGLGNSGYTNQILAEGDFNKDGNLDLIAASREIGVSPITLSFLGGNGNGTFASGLTYVVNADPIAISVADFNMDYRQDIAVAIIGFGIRILLGNGDGTFHEKASYELGEFFFGMVADDFNDDGKPDLAVPSANGDNDFGTVSIFLGNGDGSFRPVQTMPADRHPYDIVTGDFNGDHLVDLAAANRDSATIGLYLGKGDGTFQSPQFYPTGGNAYQLAAGDFNQDGRLDLVVMAYDRVDLLLNKFVPPLLLKPNPAFGGSGKSVTVTLTAAGPLTGLPTATLTGNCADGQEPVFSPTDQPNTYSSTLTLPNITSDCSLTLNAQATYVKDNAPTDGSTVIQLDASLPETSLSFAPSSNQDRVFARPPTVSINATDKVSGLDKTYYALDQTKCKPDALADCSVYSQPFIVNGEGSHTLTYFSQDKVGNTEAIQSYTFSINSTVPEVTDQDVSLDEDTPKEILLTATDAGNDPLVLTIVRDPIRGELKPLGGNRYLYTPHSQYFGPDDFTYQASDGVSTSKTGTVTLSVRSVNDPPVAESFPVSTLGGQPVSLRLRATDVEGNPLSYSIITPPANGTLDGTIPDLVYLSKPGFSGQDSFTYIARDASSESEPANVTVTVIAPLLVIGSGTAAPGGTALVPISVTDADKNVAGLDLTFQVSGPPSKRIPSPTFTSNPPNEWQVQTDPKNAWHVTLIRATGIEGPGNVVLLSFKTAVSDPLDAIYHIQPQSIILFDETGTKTTATDRTVPGEVIIVCSDRKKGDLTGDGKVSIADVTAILRMAVGISTTVNACDKLMADVNCDGEVNLGDAILTLRSTLFGESLACKG